MGCTVSTYTAFAMSRPAAVSALEVRERAATRGDIRGQVCPVPGEGGFRAFTPEGSTLSALPALSGIALPGFVLSGSAQSSTLRQSDIASRYGATTGVLRVMTNASISKPRTGYCATSSSG